MSHSIYQIGNKRDFVVVNDGDLGSEPIAESDLEPIAIQPGSPCASMAWSLDCRWYFIFQPNGIVLLNTFTNQGVRCKKRSARFIEMFLDAKQIGRAACT